MRPMAMKLALMLFTLLMCGCNASKQAASTPAPTPTPTAATATVDTGALPYLVAVDPNTNKIYVAGSGSLSLTVIDGATNNTTNVPVLGGPGAGINALG